MNRIGLMPDVVLDVSFCNLCEGLSLTVLKYSLELQQYRLISKADVMRIEQEESMSVMSVKFIIQKMAAQHQIRL